MWWVPGGMKAKIIIYFVVLSLAQSVFSQVSTNFMFRYRNPVINDTLRCDLSPLFAWWTRQLMMQTAARSNATEVVTNATPSPMPSWVHVLGEIAQEIPQGWIVDATLETAPGQGTTSRILLIHCPRNEVTRFSQHLFLVNNPLPTPSYTNEEARIKTIYNRAFLAESYGDADWEDYFISQADREQQNLESQKEHNQDLEKQRADTLVALGDFPPDWQTYQVDLFAFNTGRSQRGLPVYDAGLSFVK